MGIFKEDIFNHTASGTLRRNAYALWQEHKDAGLLPISVRFLYYELIARGQLSKDAGTNHITGERKAKKPSQELSEAVTKLREHGYIPWADIVDESRDLSQWSAYPTIAEGISTFLGYVRLDIWSGTRPPVVLCESRSLRGVLTDLAREYQVPIASVNGQCAGFLHTELADALKEKDRVLYFGDWDFSGGHIENNTRTVLESIVGPLSWTRVAITDEQVHKYDLPIIERYDKRTKKANPAVETEALGQARLVELFHDQLRTLMPDDELRTVQVRQERQRKDIQRRIQKAGVRP